MIYPILLSKQYADVKQSYLDAFSDFLDTGYFIDGTYVDEFEKNIANHLNAQYALGCGNGTQAIELALKAEHIGPGDEVITVANTYYATVRAILNVGATPIYCDVTEDGLMDPNQISRLITPQTKAILPVHLYGLSVDINAIRAICVTHGLSLIEDCSHAFGSKSNGEYIGASSTYACFSMYPTKTLGAFGDAGFILTNQKKKYDTLKKLRYYATNKEHTLFEENAMHARLDSLQACLLNVSLTFVAEWNALRQRNKEIYIEMFQGRVPYLKAMENPEVVPYVFPVLVKDQQHFLNYLKEKNILGQYHYNIDLHHLAHLNSSKEKTNPGVALSTTECLNHSIVSIPVSQTVTEDEIIYIAKCVCHYFASNA